jgi:hypothetical protein
MGIGQKVLFSDSKPPLIPSINQEMRKDDQKGKQVVSVRVGRQTEPARQASPNRFASLEMDCKDSEPEDDEEDELSPKQKRALLEIEATSKLMEDAKKTLAMLAERQKRALKDYGCEEADEIANTLCDDSNTRFVTRQEFDCLAAKIDKTMAMVQMLLSPASSKPAAAVQATPANSNTQATRGMAAKVAAAEQMRQEGLVVLRNAKGETYGVRPEVLEAKTRRPPQERKPAVLHIKGFRGLRYKEVRGLLGAYGLSVKDIIVMSFMGQHLEMVVAGEAKEEIVRVLVSKGYAHEEVNVFEGSPLKLNVDASILSAEKVQELRKRAATEARVSRWNKIIAQVPRDMTRKRALLARVRDGRLAEMQEQESPRQPERLTRLDQLVMAEVEEEMRRLEQERMPTSDSDGENCRKRKIAGRKMEVTSEQGVTRSQ